MSWEVRHAQVTRSAAFRNGPRRRALERAKHTCEFIWEQIEYKPVWPTVENPTPIPQSTMKLVKRRCAHQADLHVHHLTYVRFGRELDTDLEVLCPKHHLLVELGKHGCTSCGMEPCWSNTRLNDLWDTFLLDLHIQGYDPERLEHDLHYLSTWKRIKDTLREGVPRICDNCCTLQGREPVAVAAYFQLVKCGAA